MRRREFVALVGGTAAAWLLAARAQKPGKIPVIGFLGATTPSVWSTFVAAFLRRLRELGWIDGSTVAIEYCWAQGRDELYSEFAASSSASRSIRTINGTLQMPQAEDNSTTGVP
jgi:putative ABC transport system substrate-binding protein